MPLLGKSLTYPYLTRRLHRAVTEGATDKVAALLKKGADVNQGTPAGWTPLMSASLHGYADVIKLLLRPGADVNALTTGGQSALVVAAIFGRDECVRLLVEGGANLHYRAPRLCYTILMLAVGNCHVETVQFLVDRGANLNAKSVDFMTALKIARLRGREEMIVLLETAGAVQ